MPSKIQAVVSAIGRSHDPNIVGSAQGFRTVAGKHTGEWCAVVYVRKKLPAAQIQSGYLLPQHLDGIRIDVQEVGEFRALIFDPKNADYHPLELRDRLRPCPPGFSIGHRQVTAGTLGCYVRRNGTYYVLSNNHVLANSNEASPGDLVYQPGVLDGGSNTSNIFGNVREWVTINFPGSSRPPKKSTAIKAWKAWMWPANQLARAVGCTNRLTLRDTSRAIQQPDPNLVDAAISEVTEEWVDPVIHRIGAPTGIRDPQPGERVRKTGRTTEYTEGIVTGLGAVVGVSYGTGKGTAQFVDQIVIEQEDGGEFSAGGDSGSAIVGSDGMVVGLLFAGGSGRTIACKITEVVRLLGIQVVTE